MSIATLGAVLAIIGVLTGWLAPIVAGSRRPYGMAGDVIVSLAILVVAGIPEYLFVTDRFAWPEWFNLSAAIGDPFVLALIALWLMRKANPELPPAEGPGETTAD